MSEIVAIEAAALVKDFGPTHAVDAVDLLVPRGSCVGVAGGEGSGRSTLLRMLAGLLRPDGGSAAVLGVQIWPDPDPAKAHIALATDAPRLFDTLTVSENLQYAGILRGLTNSAVGKRVAGLERMLELQQVGRQPAGLATADVRARLSLAMALIHAPEVLLADDPFAALGSASAPLVDALLKRYLTSGGTIVTTSSDPARYRQLCDRVVVLDSGRLVADGTPAEIDAAGLLGGEPADDLEGGIAAWLSD